MQNQKHLWHTYQVYQAPIILIVKLKSFFKNKYLAVSNTIAMQVNGFSKLSKQAKIDWLLQTYFNNVPDARRVLEQYWHNDATLQELHDGFIENTLTNFYLPYAVAPNFLINDKLYAVPMAIEESSVVAAASKAAKFWLDKGGFKTEVINIEKLGHIHFTYTGTTAELIRFFRQNRDTILQSVAGMQANMQKRGGGIKDINLIDKTDAMPDYYQIEFQFDTADAMGANFINSVLEEAAETLQNLAQKQLTGKLEIVMRILSNYTPDCRVKASVSCPVNSLKTHNLSGEAYARKFVQAIKIAEVEPYRAVTHNKGIMNGIDAVVIATGNDFRAVEANAHAFAGRTGQYTSLSHAEIKNGNLYYWLEMALAVGTVGGITAIHPLVRFSLQLLQNPSAKELMQIIAASGLAQNFAAINSLITEGIQKGHMKMHLNNLLTFLKATPEERQKAEKYFSDKKVSFKALKDLLGRI